MLRIYNIPVSIEEGDEPLKNIVSRYLKVSSKSIKKAVLYKKSIDARNKDKIHFIFCVDIEVDSEDKIIKTAKKKKIEEVKKYEYQIKVNKNLSKRPVVVGFGPAGIFAGLSLAQAGQNPIIIERGSDVDERTKDVENFWKNGKLNVNSNVQFGEGGAGTFSDGKLNTGTKDVRSRKVLQEFVESGAPKEILYNAKPHIGTDKLKTTIKNIRKKIITLGGQVRFNTKLVDIVISNNEVEGVIVEGEKGTEEIKTDNVILALGHSARDTFEMLLSKKILLEPKNFSVGVRIEHLQSDINKSQYGDSGVSSKLGAADYKLSTHLKNGRGVYTFCMCPGGKVVAAASECNGVVTNGMSEFSRSEKNANSAVLVGVSPSDFKDDSPLAGVEFQREIERNAYLIGGENYFAPAQCFGDFLIGKETKSFKEVLPSYAPGVKLCDLAKIFPDYVVESLKMGILEMDKHLKGFASHSAVLTGPETRSSSPVRILRNENQESVSVKGLYPCGEGAGYAGGIISAAVDGIRCAESIMRW